VRAREQKKDGEDVGAGLAVSEPLGVKLVPWFDGEERGHVACCWHRICGRMASEQDLWREKEGV